MFGTSEIPVYPVDEEKICAARVQPESIAGDAAILDKREHDLSRSLKQRHIQMIALAGAIGTGLFLSLGGSLQTAGPLGSLLAYGLVGLVVCAVQFALGEVSALYPVTGSFVRHAEIFFHPALGFAVGWNVVYGAFMGVPSEIAAALVLIEFWTDINPAVWITIFIVITFAVAIVFIGVYGEIEFFFAMLKIMLVIGIVIMGLVIDLGGVPGQDRIGFQYWKNPGPFVEYIGSGAWGNFLGFWAVMNSAVYSFSGVESLSIAAAETQNPRQNIPKACKRVFARVVFFYLLTILIVGMIVPSNDDALNNYSGNATESPFVIAATRAGIKAVPSIINAVVLTSAWSASNQSLLSGTRVLYGLALKGQAPKIFLKTTKYGIPYMTVLLQTLFSCFAYMSVSNGALNVFWWFLDLTSCGVLISWLVIVSNHLRLVMACKAQGIDRKELPWSHWWTPYSSCFALVLCTIFLLTGGFEVFTHGNWDTATFIASYLDIPIIAALFWIWKIFKKTHMVSLRHIPIREALEEIERTPEEKILPPRGWKRINILWS